MLTRPHHYAYVVADVDQGIAQVVAMLDAGPFFVVDAVRWHDCPRPMMSADICAGL